MEVAAAHRTVLLVRWPPPPRSPTRCGRSTPGTVRLPGGIFPPPVGGDDRRVPVGPEGPPVRVRRGRDPVEPGTGGDARADRRPAGDHAGLHRLLQRGEPGLRHRRGRRGGRLSRHRDSRRPRTELRLLPEAAAGVGAHAPGALHRRGAGDARLAASVPLSAPVYVQAAAWRGVSPAATAYVERYEHRYGSPPVGYSDTLPYDAVTVLVAAWRKAGSAAAEAVVPVLERGTFAGVAGMYRFDAAHQAQWGPVPGRCGEPSCSGNVTARGSSSPRASAPDRGVPLSRCSSTASSPGGRTH